MRYGKWSHVITQRLEGQLLVRMNFMNLWTDLCPIVSFLWKKIDYPVTYKLGCVETVAHYIRV